MANGAEILWICDRGGVDVQLREGRIVARMKDGSPLREEARDFIRAFRTEVIAELERRQAQARTEAA